LAGSVLWLQRHQMAQLTSENIRLRTATEQAQKKIELDSAELRHIQEQRLKNERELTRLEQVWSARSNDHLAGFEKESATNSVKGESGPPLYVSLSKTNLHRFQLRPINDDFRLSDEAAAILGMSAAERVGVDKAIFQLITRHTQMDLNKAQQIDVHL